MDLPSFEDLTDIVNRDLGVSVSIEKIFAVVTDRIENMGGGKGRPRRVDARYYTNPTAARMTLDNRDDTMEPRYAVRIKTHGINALLLLAHSGHPRRADFAPMIEVSVTPEEQRAAIRAKALKKLDGEEIEALGIKL